MSRLKRVRHSDDVGDDGNDSAMSIDDNGCPPHQNEELTGSDNIPRHRKVVQPKPQDYEETTFLSNISRRYNGLHPQPQQGHQTRVPTYLYPDPTMYGWIFTGSSCHDDGNGNNDSHDPVEFYEIESNGGIVLLDFYFTSGTAKTMFYQKAPSLSCFELFAKGRQLLPEVFIKILQNPRYHTDVRYQRY